jgi:hypothetical protein
MWMHEVHHTEACGYEAIWQLEGHRGTSDMTPIASYGPGCYPDLARARELLPGLTGLWDAVRHDFWSRLLPRHRPSPTTGSI